eukprot:Rhum_TRINITY_DN14249_c6_g2::Rhum_TRINITY_DN14249_c6_g2_i1::g.76901::m.76901
MRSASLLLACWVGVSDACTGTSKQKWCTEEYYTNSDEKYIARTPPSSASQAPCGAKTTCIAPALQSWQETAIVDEFNKYRAHHGACPLKYNAAVGDWVKSTAGFALTCSGTMKHNHDPNYGETIATVFSMNALNVFDPGEAANHWYCHEEGCYTNYDSNDFVPGLGHFTQTVWRGTTEVGCAMCQKPQGPGTLVFVFCGFTAPGNVGHQFVANVKRAGTPVPSTCSAGSVTPPGPGVGATPAPGGPATPGGQSPAGQSPAVGPEPASTSSSSGSNGFTTFVLVMFVLYLLGGAATAGIFVYFYLKQTKGSSGPEKTDPELMLETSLVPA